MVNLFNYFDVEELKMFLLMLIILLFVFEISCLIEAVIKREWFWVFFFLVCNVVFIASAVPFILNIYGYHG